MRAREQEAIKKKGINGKWDKVLWNPGTYRVVQRNWRKKIQDPCRDFFNLLSNWRNIFVRDGRDVIERNIKVRTREDLNCNKCKQKKKDQKEAMR